jgi:K+-sensing histidine kinase KdpD
MLIRFSSQSMADRYTEMLVASFVHDLRSIMTHLQVNCYSLIEEVIADAGSQAKRYGVRVRNDLQLLESSVEDMVTFTRPVSTERLPERLAVLVAEALELTRDSVRKAKLDPDSYRSNRTCQNRSSCPWRGTKS